MSTAVVKILDSTSNAEALSLAAVNFWFRHVLVFCSPLISGTILACALTGTSPATTAIMGLPVAASFIIFGGFFFIKPIKFTSFSTPSNQSVAKASDAVIFVLVASTATFTTSLATGSSLPSAAIDAPVAASMLPGSASAVFTVIFAGFAAKFLTPSHLCPPISAEYFEQSTSRLIAKIFPAFCASALAGGLFCTLYFSIESAAF